MLNIIKKQLPVELTEEMASNLRQSLQARYNSLLHKVRLEYLSRLGLEPDSCNLTDIFKESPLILGELYLPEAGTIFYIKAKRGENLIQAGVITNDEPRDTEEFFSEIRDILAGICDKLPSWQLSPDLKPLDIEDAEVMEEPTTPEQLTAAKSLMHRDARGLLGQIKNAGSIFLNKIEYANREVLEKLIHSFTDLGLVSLDYAVLCRRTGQQILRVSDKATIDESSQKAFKCFICGNQISDELIEEVLACTDSGAKMLSNSNWLLVVVRGILAELGIPGSAMKIYHSKGLPVQIFLSINGLHYLFVLCTEPMTLDQAYLVGAHLAAYKLNCAIVISTERITTLMRSHLEHTSPNARFEFLDQIEDVSTRLRYIIFEQQRDNLESQLKDMICLTKVDVASLVLQRMIPIPEELKKAVEEVQEVEQTPEVIASTENVETAAEELPVPEQSEVEQPEVVENGSEDSVMDVQDNGEPRQGKKGKKRH